MKQTAIREVYVAYLGTTGVDSTFEVKFHDGYVKRFKLSATDCITHRMSERDLLENLIIEYYEATEDSTPQLRLFFS